MAPLPFLKARLQVCELDNNRIAHELAVRMALKHCPAGTQEEVEQSGGYLAELYLLLRRQIKERLDAEPDPDACPECGSKTIEFRPLAIGGGKPVCFRNCFLERPDCRWQISPACEASSPRSVPPSCADRTSGQGDAL